MYGVPLDIDAVLRNGVGVCGICGVGIGGATGFTVGDRYDIGFFAFGASASIALGRCAWVAFIFGLISIFLFD